MWTKFFMNENLDLMSSVYDSRTSSLNQNLLVILFCVGTARYMYIVHNIISKIFSLNIIIIFMKCLFISLNLLLNKCWAEEKHHTQSSTRKEYWGKKMLIVLISQRGLDVADKSCFDTFFFHYNLSYAEHRFYIEQYFYENLYSVMELTTSRALQ